VDDNNITSFAMENRTCVSLGVSCNDPIDIYDTIINFKAMLWSETSNPKIGHPWWDNLPPNSPTFEEIHIRIYFRVDTF